MSPDAAPKPMRFKTCTIVRSSGFCGTADFTRPTCQATRASAGMAATRVTTAKIRAARTAARMSDLSFVRRGPRGQISIFYPVARRKSRSDSGSGATGGLDRILSGRVEKVGTSAGKDSVSRGGPVT